jgi:hypothetical protein
VSETIVCGVASWFTHVTTVPVFTVRVDGSNAKFFIVIVVPPPVGAGVDAVAEGVW